MDEIKQVIEAYEPRRFDPIGDVARLDLVKRAVAPAPWKSPKDARSAMTHAFAFTGWLSEQGHHLDLSAFTPERIDAYLDERKAPKGTRDAVRSYLLRLVPHQLPELLEAAGLAWPGALDRIWPVVIERAAGDG
jgi:hypothetical protein